MTAETQVSPLAGEVDALVFDVFGTVVDWRSSVTRAGEEIGRQTGQTVDWAALADEWRRVGYHEHIAEIRRGEAPWETVDVFMRRKLEHLLGTYRVRGLSDEQFDWLARAWHRLDGWPDSVEGLGRLKRRYTIATLSNGNVALLTDMAKYAGLPWDCILSAELVGRYKPDPETYRSAGRFLGVPLNRVVMTAAHLRDLYAAREQGLRTAFVRRPLEWGPDGTQEGEPDDRVDIVARDFVDLARQLGA
ncbi:MAG: haloacid dehalogenase type II [Chloroflexi bacterium]|nr:haloacid dehalogenase type II [Chloroflexota bacterium]